MSHKKHERADAMLDEDIDDSPELEAVVHKSTRPTKQRVALGRETKVGLVVIIALLFIFSLVLIKRLIGPAGTDLADDVAAADDTTINPTADTTGGSSTENLASNASPSADNKSPFDLRPTVMQPKTEKIAGKTHWGAETNPSDSNKPTTASDSGWGGAGTAYGAAATKSSNTTRSLDHSQAPSPGAYGGASNTAGTSRTSNGFDASSASDTNKVVAQEKNNPLRSGSTGMTAGVVDSDRTNTNPFFPRNDTGTALAHDDKATNSAAGPGDASVVAQDNPNSAYGAQTKPVYGSQSKSTYSSIADESAPTPINVATAAPTRTTDPFAARGNRNSTLLNEAPRFEATADSPKPLKPVDDRLLQASPDLNRAPAATASSSVNEMAKSNSQPVPFEKAAPLAKATPMDRTTAPDRLSAAGTQSIVKNAFDNRVAVANDARRAPATLSNSDIRGSTSAISGDASRSINPAVTTDSKSISNATKVASSAKTAMADARTSTVVEPSYSTYRVKTNDTYWTISERLYGTGSYFKALYEHNRLRIDGADRLSAGVELQTPDAATLERLYTELCPKVERAGATQLNVKRPTSATGQTYVVEEGDTLLEIARRQLGKSTRWAEIYQLNRELLGMDLDYLRPGTELILPDEAR